MAKKLTDPSKPAHEIVEVLEDGDAIRNDGVRLTAANKNAWYVLATIYGEQEEGAGPWGSDRELAVKNRNAWNLWMCHGLSDDELADRAEKVGLAPSDLVPFKDGFRDVAKVKTGLVNIRAKIVARLEKAGVKKPEPPEPAQCIGLRQVYFDRFINCEGFVFEQHCNFANSVFRGYASFKSVIFCGEANFETTIFCSYANFRLAAFSRYANFRYATFKTIAYFDSAMFNSSAYFRSATFNDDVSFVATTFNYHVYFGLDYSGKSFNCDDEQFSVTFAKKAVFNSAKFKSTTWFKNARFLTAVPQFHAAQLYDDTVFPAADSEQGNWPPLRKRVKVAGEWQDVMPAAEQKRAYNRLRLFMNKSLQLDEEQFFHRMEMRCKTGLARWYHKPLYWLYGGLSDYGNSVWRPLFCMFFMMLSSALFILWWQEAFTFLPKEASGFDWTLGLLGEDDLCGKLLEAAGWSISNTLPFLGFGKLYYGGEFAANLAWPLKVVGGVQTVAGFILLFFFGLGLRNRFRLR